MTLIEPTRVRLWNARAALEIRAPLPGVVRLRHAPLSIRSSLRHPHLPERRSVAVIAREEHRLNVREHADRVEIGAEGLRLEVDRRTFQWTLFDPSNRVLAASVALHGQVQEGYPEPLWRSTLALAAPEDEAYLGFGEKVGPLDKRGMHFVFWNSDVLPHLPDTDPLYVSIPFFIGLRGGVAWGCFLDETWRSEVDVARGDPGQVQWEVSGPEIDLYLLAGPHPVSVLERFSALTGRTPLPPLWSLGAHQSRWGYQSSAEVLEVVRAYRERDLPLDGVFLDIDHMSGYRTFTWDRGRFPDPAGLARECLEAGVRLLPIIDPGLKLEPGYAPYDEALARDLLVRDDRGNVLIAEVWPEPCAFPDLTREDAQAWWAGLHRGFLQEGVGGFWNDMNEPSAFSVREPTRDLTPPVTPRGLPPKVEGQTLPYDARHGDRRHLEVHNAYGLGMARACFDAFRRYAPERRPFILTRAGFAGIQRYAAVWTGDNSSTWAHLEQSIPMLLGLSLSGVPFVGADVPGFLGEPSPELLVRWTQLGAFYPFLRNHSARGTPPKEPWRFGEPWLSQIRQALQLRYRLLPTLYTLMHDAAQSGLPPLRAMPLDAPGEPDAVRAFDQFLFGSDLLVCPIVRPGQTRRLAWIPPGRWLETPALGSAGQVHQGPAHVVLDAPPERIPLLLREGGALPLTTSALHTRSADWSELEWLVHAGARIVGRLWEDAGEGYDSGRETRIRGGLAGGKLWLERTLDGPPPRDRVEERVRLLGLPGRVRSVTGAALRSGNSQAAELIAPADWRRIDVDL